MHVPMTPVNAEGRAGGRGSVRRCSQTLINRLTQNQSRARAKRRDCCCESRVVFAEMKERNAEGNFCEVSLRLHILKGFQFNGL